MKMQIAVNLLALVILSACGPKSSLEKLDLSCAVVHKPVKGECPKGYSQEATPRFTERDGSKEFACLSRDPAKQQCIDELRGGESVGFPLHIPGLRPEPPAPKPAGERKL